MRVGPSLGPELSRLIVAVGRPLVSAAPLTRWPSALRKRGAWRLSFAGGPVLKGVRFDSSAAADRVDQILNALGPQHFPQVLARRGAAMLLPWVEGPSAHAWGPAELRRAALVQAWMHGLDPAHLPSQSAAGTESWEVRLEAASERVEPQVGPWSTELRRLLASAHRHAPVSAGAGIVHGDFCAENIVVPSPERLFVVDNETLHLGAPDYDLARTWYRWPMRAADWRTYLCGYAERRSPGEFEARYPYWSVLVLLESARWHLVLATGGAGGPLRRLRALARRLVRAGPGAASCR